tara:strand:+ start:1023 stop:1289 length:267 start_codon:yes stop_codon:yes gene_type:complete
MASSDRWRDLGTGWLNKWKKHDPNGKNSPFFKGSATINGEEMLMTGWIKQGKYGAEDQSIFVSFTVENELTEDIKQAKESVSLEDLFK